MQILGKALGVASLGLLGVRTLQHARRGRHQAVCAMPGAPSAGGPSLVPVVPPPPPPSDRIRIMRPSCIRACINMSKYELERSRSAAVVHRTFVTLLAAF